MKKIQSKINHKNERIFVIVVGFFDFVTNKNFVFLRRKHRLFHGEEKTLHFFYKRNVIGYVEVVLRTNDNVEIEFCLKTDLFLYKLKIKVSIV